MRRALATARSQGTTSSGARAPLPDGVARVAATSAPRTGLGAAGRSVVGVALDLAERELPAWPGVRALLVGTGSYAGASLAALRRRGCPRRPGLLARPAGRPTFAESRGVTAVHDGGLAEAIGTSDLVVACSGTVGRVLDAELVARTWAATGHPLVIADLALRNDVDPAVGTLPGVRLINLDTIRRHAPEEHSAPVELAHELVAAAADDFEAAARARELEAAVVAERRRVLGRRSRRRRAACARASREVAAPAGDALAGDAPAGEAEPASGVTPAPPRRARRRPPRAPGPVPAPAHPRDAAPADRPGPDRGAAGDDRAYRAALAELAAIPAPTVPVPPTVPVAGQDPVQCAAGRVRRPRGEPGAVARAAGQRPLTGAGSRARGRQPAAAPSRTAGREGSVRQVVDELLGEAGVRGRGEAAAAPRRRRAGRGRR